MPRELEATLRHQCTRQYTLLDLNYAAEAGNPAGQRNPLASDTQGNWASGHIQGLKAACYAAPRAPRMRLLLMQQCNKIMQQCNVWYHYHSFDWPHRCSSYIRYQIPYWQLVCTPERKPQSKRPKELDRPQKRVSTCLGLYATCQIVHPVKISPQYSK